MSDVLSETQDEAAYLRCQVKLLTDEIECLRVTDLDRKAQLMLKALRLEKERQALRDQFAAAALSGMLARPSIDDDPLEFHFLCEHAYKWADAMMDHRGRVSSGR